MHSAGYACRFFILMKTKFIENLINTLPPFIHRAYSMRRETPQYPRCAPNNPWTRSEPQTQAKLFCREERQASCSGAMYSLTTRRYQWQHPCPLSGQDGMGKSSSEGPHVRSHGLKDSGVGSQSTAQQPSGMSELQPRGALCRGGNTLQTCLYTSPDRTPVSTLLICLNDSETRKWLWWRHQLKGTCVSFGGCEQWRVGECFLEVFPSSDGH